MKYIISLTFLLFYNLVCSEAGIRKFDISSPDKNTSTTVEIGESITFSVKYKGKDLILPSAIGLTIGSETPVAEGLSISHTSTRFVQNTIIPVVSEKRSLIPDSYNELIIQFISHKELQIRVYNDGVAYRFATSIGGEITITGEEAVFNLPVNTIAFYPQVSKRTDADIFHTSFEENYTKSKLDTLGENMFAFTPVLLQPEGLPEVLITESDVTDYPGMFLSGSKGSRLKAVFAGYPAKEVESGSGFRQKLVDKRESFIARTNGTRTYPWRVLAIANNDAELLTNDIVYRLAPDPDFKDFSWIKPGKSTEEWITGLNLYKVDFIAGLNTRTYKYYIDFAARFGFQYVMLDAGWSDVNDLTAITPGMDMEELSSYANQKGIGLILWTQALTLEKQMDTAMNQFRKWGIKIVMTDFIDRNDQLTINFLHRFARECERNHFMGMIHGAPIPAGFSRTHPGMLARESVLGSEYNAWSSRANPVHDLLLPFIRMVSGPMDYEPGLLQNASRDQPGKMGFEKVLAQGTTMHQMAMFEIYESPLQLFSGNLSDALREPDLMDFLGKLPTVWDETLILRAELGKYIVEARRTGNEWYVAAMNDWTPQEFLISLDFLNDGKFLSETAADGINATRNPQDYQISQAVVTSKDNLSIKLAPGGGFLCRISVK